MRLFHRKFVTAVVAVIVVLDIRDPFRLALLAEVAAVEAAAFVVLSVSVEAAAVVPSQICNGSIIGIISTRYKRSTSSGSLW